MDWRDVRVLVTGAEGFMGSHLVERLACLGAKVRCFVGYNFQGRSGCLELLPESLLDAFDIFAGNLANMDDVEQAMQGCEVVFHLGALVSVPHSYVSPRSHFETNCMGTLNVLEAARKLSVRKVIHTSSSEVYGTAQYIPIDEKHPLRAQSPYAGSKIAADKAAESYYYSYGLPVATLRPFNFFGPRQSARAVIPTIITQVLGTRNILLGNLHPTRDYTYYSDAVDGFIKLAESSITGRTINLGTGTEISIGEIARKVCDLVGCSAAITADEKRIRAPASEVDRLCCDNSLAKELLGWQPRVTFEDGLKSTIAWISQHLGLYKPGMYAL